jgi:hypothetical protein
MGIFKRWLLATQVVARARTLKTQRKFVFLSNTKIDEFQPARLVPLIGYAALFIFVYCTSSLLTKL